MTVSINGDGTITGLVITTADLADSSVTTAKIAAGAVATVDIADSAVTTAKIADANVTIAKLSATGTPSSSNYLRGDGSWQTVSTTPTTDQVLTATAGATAGAVGTYTTATRAGTMSTPGTTVAGSSLLYVDPCGSNASIGFTGTWRFMGGGDSRSYGMRTYLRIS